VIKGPVRAGPFFLAAAELRQAGPFRRVILR